jgi:hypothetical protein
MRHVRNWCAAHPVFLPELGGRTLDEIDLLFHENISAVASSRWKPDTLHELEAIALGEHGDKGNREDDQKEDIQQIERPPRVWNTGEMRWSDVGQESGRNRVLGLAEELQGEQRTYFEVGSGLVGLL